jgi:hypothetical protein
MTIKPITTYGWDLVFATRSTILNQGLKSSGREETFTAHIQRGEVAVNAHGTLEAWQIAQGGSGAIVHFKVPCTSLNLSGAGKSFNFSDGYFLVQGTLILRPSKNTTNSSWHDLVLVTGQGKLVVINASFSQSTFDSVASYAQSAFQVWLDALSDLPYIFARVQLSDGNDASSAGILLPTTASYAYTDTKDNGGILGVLCTVGSNLPQQAQLLQEISPDAVSVNDNATVLLGEKITKRLLTTTASSIT